MDRIRPSRRTGRLGYHPSVLLKLYIYGYLNRVQSSRRHGAGRPDEGVEVMWLTGRLVPDQEDDCELSQGQWPSDPQGLRQVCRALPSS